MKNSRASFGAALTCAVLIGVGLLLGATNDSVFAGLPLTFGSLHLVFDLIDLSSMDSALAGALAPGAAIVSNGLTDALGQSRLPDLGTVVNADDMGDAFGPLRRRG